MVPCCLNDLLAQNRLHDQASTAVAEVSSKNICIRDLERWHGVALTYCMLASYTVWGSEQLVA